MKTPSWDYQSKKLENIQKLLNEKILSDSYKNTLRSKRFLAHRGSNELITWSFTSSKDSKFYIDDQNGHRNTINDMSRRFYLFQINTEVKEKE